MEDGKKVFLHRFSAGQKITREKIVRFVVVVVVVVLWVCMWVLF